jgi:hypothetical protein
MRLTAEDLRELVIHAHAVEAIENRNVSLEDLADVLLRPEITEPSGDRTRFVKGELVAVVAEDYRRPGRYIVLTILWRKFHQWTDAEMRNR